MLASVACVCGRGGAPHPFLSGHTEISSRARCYGLRRNLDPLSSVAFKLHDKTKFRPFPVELEQGLSSNFTGRTWTPAVHKQLTFIAILSTSCSFGVRAKRPSFKT